jgi:hypothetical protein
MNLKQFFVSAGIAVSTVALSAPAFAGGLTASNLASLNGFTFDTTTNVNFKFVASYGGYKSNFAVYSTTDGGVTRTLVEDLFTELNGDSPATCPDDVVPCTKQFKFLAGTTYLLGLRNIKPSGGQVFSDNPVGGADAGGMRFFQGAGTTSYPNNNGTLLPVTLTAGQVGIFVNDTYKGDLDTNDFVLTAEAVPEPATLAGLGMVAGGMLMARRRKAIA